MKVSFGSTVVSPSTDTGRGRLVVPGANVSAPDAAVKSVPAVAVPASVA